MRIQIFILGFKGLIEGGCLGGDCLIEVQLYKHHSKIKFQQGVGQVSLKDLDLTNCFRFSGCKESQFYSLSFGQAVASAY